MGRVRWGLGWLKLTHPPTHNPTPNPPPGGALRFRGTLVAAVPFLSEGKAMEPCQGRCSGVANLVTRTGTGGRV